MRPEEKAAKIIHDALICEGVYPRDVVIVEAAAIIAQANAEHYLPLLSQLARLSRHYCSRHECVLTPVLKEAIDAAEDEIASLEAVRKEGES